MEAPETGCCDETSSDASTLQRKHIYSEIKKLKAPMRAKSTGSLRARVDAAAAPATSSVVGHNQSEVLEALLTSPEVSMRQGMLTTPPWRSPGTFLDEDGKRVNTPGRRSLASPLPGIGIPDTCTPESALLRGSKSMPHLAATSPDAFAAFGAKAFDLVIPASKLDLMDLSAKSPKQLSSLEVTLADTRFAIPFDTTAWGNAPEALGELFATKLLGSEVPGGKKKVKDSKKGKDATMAFNPAATMPDQGAWVMLEDVDGADSEASPMVTNAFSKSASKSSSARRQKKARPSSTGTLHRKQQQQQQMPSGLSCDQRPCSRRSLEPLPVAAQLEEKKLASSQSQPLLSAQRSVESAMEDLLKSMHPGLVVEKPLAEQDDSRPSTASEQHDAAAELWNNGFNDNNDSHGDAACVWDGARETYYAWGGDDDDWAVTSQTDSDWGDDGAMTARSSVPVF